MVEPRAAVQNGPYDELIEVARQGSPGNAAIVVISDDDDNASSHSTEETKSLFVRSSWPPVFGLVVDYVHGGDEHRGTSRRFLLPLEGLSRTHRLRRTFQR